MTTMLQAVFALWSMIPWHMHIAQIRMLLFCIDGIACVLICNLSGLYTNFSSIAQCGAFGALMAILSISLSMTLVTTAMRVNGFPFIESICTGCILSATVVGLVDIGWSRRQVNVINPCSLLTSKVIA